jgi:DNA-binding transcriptional MerR regulator
MHAWRCAGRLEGRPPGVAPAACELEASRAQSFACWRAAARIALVKVSDVAAAAGIASHIVRYYSTLGLLKPGRNSTNRYREFSNDDVYRLRFILRAKSAGFTLSDIRLILRDADSGVAPCPRVRALVRQRAIENDARLAEANRLRRRMRAAMRTWEGIANRAPDHQSLCVLIDAIALDEPVPAIHTRRSSTKRTVREGGRR